MLPQAKLEAIVLDDRTDETLPAIVAVSRAGKIGDSKVLVSAISKVVRIRSSEMDDDAIWLRRHSFPASQTCAKRL